MPKKSLLFSLAIIAITFTLFFSTSVYAKRAGDYSEIIKNLDIYGARDWIEINREILLDPRLPNNMRDQLRQELVLVKQRLEQMHGELADSEFDKQRGIIIEERIKDIQNILNNYETDTSIAQAALPPSLLKNTNEEKILNNILLLDELLSYQKEVQQTLNRMTSLYWGPNASKTLKASFKKAGCSLDHWKAWGDWIYTASQNIYPRQQKFLDHINKSISTAKKKGVIKETILNDIRRGMQKWRLDVKRSDALFRTLVNTYTKRGLALQERNKFNLGTSEFDIREKNYNKISNQIPPISNSLKDPKLFNIHISSKQDNQLKDQTTTDPDENEIEYDMTLQDMETLRNDILNDSGRFSMQADGMTETERIEWLEKIDWMQANVEYRISSLALGAEHADDPEKALSDMIWYQMYYRSLFLMREKVQTSSPIDDSTNNENSIMNEIEDFHVYPWEIYENPKPQGGSSDNENSIMNEIEDFHVYPWEIYENPKPQQHKSVTLDYDKTYVKKVSLKNNKTAQMTYIGKHSKKPSKVEILNPAGRPDSIILYSRDNTDKAKSFQYISTKGSQRIESTKEIIRVFNYDKNTNTFNVKSFSNN